MSNRSRTKVVGGIPIWWRLRICRARSLSCAVGDPVGTVRAIDVHLLELAHDGGTEVADRSADPRQNGIPLDETMPAIVEVGRTGLEVDRKLQCVENFDRVATLLPGSDQSSGAVALRAARKDDQFHEQISTVSQPALLTLRVRPCDDACYIPCTRTRSVRSTLFAPPHAPPSTVERARDQRNTGVAPLHGQVSIRNPIESRLASVNSIGHSRPNKRTEVRITGRSASWPQELRTRRNSFTGACTATVSLTSL